MRAEIDIVFWYNMDRDEISYLTRVVVGLYTDDVTTAYYSFKRVGEDIVDFRARLVETAKVLLRDGNVIKRDI